MTGLELTQGKAAFGDRVVITCREQWEQLRARYAGPKSGHPADLSGAVVITSLPEVAAECRRLGVFCIGYVPEGSTEYFPDVSYVVERLDALEETEIETERRRFYGLPVWVVETERLRLREGLLEDYPALHGMVYQAEAGGKTELGASFLNSDFLASSSSWDNYVRTAYALYGVGYYVAVRKETPGEIVGICGLAPFFGRMEEETGLPPYEMGYFTAPAHRRQGFATEMGRAVLNLAGEKGLQEVFLRIPETNAASLRVASHLGNVKVLPAGWKKESGRSVPTGMIDRTCI